MINCEQRTVLKGAKAVVVAIFWLLVSVVLVLLLLAVALVVAIV
jgi:hypothetical protein